MAEDDFITQRGVVVSEDMAALEFAHMRGGRMAYCHDHGKWFEYDGHIWRMCRTPSPSHYIREMCRKLSQDATSGAKLQELKYIRAVEGLAKNDPIFARHSDYWDQDHFLLGTPNGTVDLRNGRLRQSMQVDNITKSVAVEPDEIADCGTWLKFLDEATGHNEEMILFLQQIAGYALTGDISEQALFFIHGPGGSGKSVFINTLKAILHDYAKAAGMDTFAAHRSSQHPTDIADLRGARLVTASETEEGAAWAEARIKQLTGGDVLKARFMRQDFFEYMPQFTLVIVGNHKPTLRTVDEAMRRRFNIIPFLHKPLKPDTKLQQKLKAEWPSILRWMIDGCLSWQKHGLLRPAAVIEATAEYFEDQNLMQQWVQEACNVDMTRPLMTENAGSLFDSWAKFAKANGIPSGTSKSFKPALERLGFKYKRTSTSRNFQCIELIRPSAPDYYDN